MVVGVVVVVVVVVVASSLPLSEVALSLASSERGEGNIFDPLMHNGIFALIMFLEEKKLLFFEVRKHRSIIIVVKAGFFS